VAEFWNPTGVQTGWQRTLQSQDASCWSCGITASCLYHRSRPISRRVSPARASRGSPPRLGNLPPGHRPTSPEQFGQPDWPAAVLTDLVGMHINTVVRWAGRAERDWARYLASRGDSPACLRAR
jgi:hypothetical protein